MIIEEMTDLLKSFYRECLKQITVKRIVVGVYSTGIKLSNGCGDVSYTPTADLHGFCYSILSVKGTKSGALKGTIVHNILQLPSFSPLMVTVKIVALSTLCQDLLVDRTIENGEFS